MATWKVYKTQLVRATLETNHLRFGARLSDNCRIKLRGYRILYKSLLNRSASATPLAPLSLPCELLRSSTTHLHFRCQVRIHHCSAPVRGGTNLLRRDSG